MMKMRRRRKVTIAQMRYEKAWEWGVNRVSKVMFEQSRKMSMALYQVYAAVREANALAKLNAAAEANGEEL